MQTPECIAGTVQATALTANVPKRHTVTIYSDGGQIVADGVVLGTSAELEVVYKNAPAAFDDREYEIGSAPTTGDAGDIGRWSAFLIVLVGAASAAKGFNSVKMG